METETQEVVEVVEETTPDVPSQIELVWYNPVTEQYEMVKPPSYEQNMVIIEKLAKIEETQEFVFDGVLTLQMWSFMICVLLVINKFWRRGA